MRQCKLQGSGFEQHAMLLTDCLDALRLFDDVGRGRGVLIVDAGTHASCQNASVEDTAENDADAIFQTGGKSSCSGSCSSKV